MSDIRLDSVLIHDLNQNDLFDVGDTVDDPAGRPLPPQEQSLRLSSTLKNLGASSWKNLWLSEAAAYLDNFKAAEQASLNGDAEETRAALNLAQEAQKNLPIPFQQGRADMLMMQALTKQIPLAFQEADKIAQAGGEINDVKDFLDSAEAAVNELNQVYGTGLVFNQPLADQILSTAYTQGIPNLYTQAEQLAKKGDMTMVRIELSRLQIFTQEANQRFNLALQFDQARADQAMMDAYINGIPLLYPQAEALALRGQTRRVRGALAAIQRHISEANNNFGMSFVYDAGRADHILEQGLFYGVQDNYKVALSFAKRRNITQAKYWLKQANDYVNEYNQNHAVNKGLPFLVFDQARANLIEACAKGAGPCI